MLHWDATLFIDIGLRKRTHSLFADGCKYNTRWSGVLNAIIHSMEIDYGRDLANFIGVIQKNDTKALHVNEKNLYFEWNI